MRLSFTKMQGCANDYIYLDCRTGGPPADIASLARQLSARHVSVGADGVICICAPQTTGAAATMRIYNADGSEGMMCGNGIRCVAQWLRTHDPDRAGADTRLIDTRSGPKTLRWQGQGSDAREGLWQVEMGRYSLLADSLPAVNMGPGPLVDCTLHAAGRDWRVTCVSVGNPHCVVVVPDVDSLDLAAIGPAFEKHPNFPRQVNTEFIQPLGPDRLKMRVWERGSGETWACGTGACASVAAATQLGLCDPGQDIRVQLRGGVLTIRVLPGQDLRMTGPAFTVCEGEALL